MVWYGMAWFGLMFSRKNPCLYLVPELRYPWFGLVWYGIAWYTARVLSRSTTTQNLEVLALKLAELQLFEKSVQIRHTAAGAGAAVAGGKIQLYCPNFRTNELKVWTV